MNLINLIFKDLTTQRALFKLSNFAFETLKEYEEDGYIELEKFVEDSIKTYLNEYSGSVEKGSLDKLNTYSMPHLISQVEATEDCSIELALKEN